jgi:predicted RNA-binding Zn-ribbon protein involved in translation (DUF1610 family)
MRKIKYTLVGGKVVEIEYDENAPCVSCGLPVVAASMGGTKLCPGCDMGVYRDNEKWDMRDLMDADYRRIRAQAKRDARLPS